MALKGFKNHPYIPNSVPTKQEAMLKELGLSSFDDLHVEVPEEIKLKKPMNLPEALGSEYELRDHVEGILAKNITSKRNINFMGGGCWQHYVPAICDEINSRGEFLTAYGGEPYNDHGRFQALFEYQSLMAELVDMEVVNVPTMDWAQAASTAIRMAGRINGRRKVLMPKTVAPERLMVIKNYVAPDLEVVLIDYDEKTGLMDLDHLKKEMDETVSSVYIENPSYLGFIETRGQEISDMAHSAGAQSIVGVDPSSLGVLEAPSNYGADIICGDLQPLGMHMNYGGGQSGFMATRDEETYVMEFPSRLFGIAPTTVEGEYGFGDVAYDRTSFGHHREHGKEYVGTQTALWGITAGVYLSTMGPEGMFELGQTILQRSQYAISQLSGVKGVKGSRFEGANFKEFVVDFNGTGKTVREINGALLNKGIFGGIDLSKDFPELGQSALYCVTEIHTQEKIDTLVNALTDVLEA